ncbi:head fiber protein [Heyndrickxia oleronia]|uniref:Head fiber protein n=1 Tax=Heyndrickxia oleronia TaxID=38875 RepID=A0A8E2I8N4_9BACI|nr:head fiber protein [Heyndrickxia oleronia]MEC1375009.1 head fiber protein [Heyndrickxia oleronia]OOP68714.1 Head fiber protein [Heyndrickxia oleronia]QQZ04559.1 Head fiber protein [Heyndrickxia oleronia]
MSYNTKNYTEQGGEKTVIGGVLEIKEGASVTGLPVLENQADSIATDVAGLVTDFNSLLAKLKAAGLMEAD